MATLTAQKEAPFVLPTLPYPEDALAPIISAKTLRFHHGNAPHGLHRQGQRVGLGNRV
jgi:superoxide dismutase